ncbi:helix-turn-helix domain-containing protein [Xanthomonas albilineans]|nr:helix-turn-helix transcriptional regulator [Xanthomonas albilineans]
MAFSHNLKRLRQARGMTQEELALACGWGGQSRVANYESNSPKAREPKLSELSAIAEALCVSITELLTDHDLGEIGSGVRQPALISGHMIGDRLKDLREAAGMNQPEFAAIAKTSKQYVGRLEKGYNKDPNPKFIELWARHFGVRMEWITAGKLPKDAGSKDVQRPAEVITASRQVDPRLLSRVHALLAIDRAYDLGNQEDAILFARAYEWLAQQGEVADSPQSFDKFLRWAAVR